MQGKLILLSLVATTECLAGQQVDRSGETLPNIVVIMADDLGYGDLGCYAPDSKIATPHIDRLAREGMRFTDAHAAAAVCVPTRYGLLTGRYPFRIKKGRRGPLIDQDRMTIASLLRERGYRTAMVGKWHLGLTNEKKPAGKRLSGGPVDRGFDSYFGIPASLDIPPYYYIRDSHCVAPPDEEIAASHTKGWTRIQGAFWRAGGVAPGFRHEEVLPRFEREAVRLLHESVEMGKPFFLYLALPAPHTPWLPAAEFRGKSGAGMYGDFVMQVDAVVGRILAVLEELEGAANTLVIFTSDNGPVWYPQDVERFGHAATGRFRGMKGDAWEGGHRMPFLARWPHRILPGSISEALICHNDLLATFAALTGEPLPKEAEVDSYDLSPVLLGRGEDPRREVVSQSSRGVLSIREGDWKLIPELGSCGFSRPGRVEWKEGLPRGQLYNLREDPGEMSNVYDAHPDVVERLTLRLEEIRSRPSSR